jgi:hypothetical protein
MIERQPIYPNRTRIIRGSFAFIEHRFLRHGFFAGLTHHELVLYLFLILAADRNGLSYYGYDKICTLLRITLDEYLLARNALITKDLIAFDGYLYQVLSLPPKLIDSTKALTNKQEMKKHDPATINKMIVETFKK